VSPNIEPLPTDAPDNGPLVTAWRLDGAGGGTEIGWGEVNAGVEGPVWIHLHFPNPEAQRWLVEASGLDEVVTDAMLAEETRPRAVTHGSGILANLRGVNLNPGAEAEDMVSVRIWLEPGRIITTRRRHLRSVDDVRAALVRGGGPENPAALMALLAERLAERASDVVEALSDQVDDLEEAATRRDPQAVRHQVADCRHRAVQLRRYLAPQRDALGRVAVERVGSLSDDDRLLLREVVDRLTRTVEELDMARERSQVIQEEITSYATEQLSRRMYVLSLVAGVFLPLSFVTGLLGINVGGIPGSDNPDAFRWVMAMLGVVFLGLLATFRWVRWW